jgi:hypothetical protein
VWLCTPARSDRMASWSARSMFDMRGNVSSRRRAVKPHRGLDAVGAGPSGRLDAVGPPRAVQWPPSGRRGVQVRGRIGAYRPPHRHRDACRGRRAAVGAGAVGWLTVSPLPVVSAGRRRAAAGVVGAAVGPHSSMVSWCRGIACLATYGHAVYGHGDGRASSSMLPRGCMYGAFSSMVSGGWGGEPPPAPPRRRYERRRENVLGTKRGCT